MAVVEYEEMVTTPEEAHVRTRVYAKRWVVLAVHMLFCACSSFHWVQYAVVGDQVARYYCVPAARVQDTSLAFMGCVAALVLPACFLIDVMGVEWGQLLGGLLMMLGSWFKVTAVAPGRFSLLLLAQAAAGVAELSVAGAAPRLAAAWFDARQLPFARAAAALGSELGMALGLLLPPTIVRPHDDPQDIGGDLRRLGSSTAVASTVVMVLVVLLFRDRPRLPPSSEQACLRSRRAPATPRGFASTLRRLLTSRDYLLLLAAHGLARGALSAILTQLNPVVTRHFPDGQEFTGRVGLVIVAVGLLGCALFGAALRWTRKHKQMTIAAYILMAAATCIFAFALRTEDPLCVYFSAGVMGRSVCGRLPWRKDQSPF
ncbi:heme transporter FLVCR1-like isoform X2 [Bacillus rossius redtenbacheri]|uniref:heme transporter FLVCR1-like isoform X2 n=1 Tax=Bacillus rossius redtenbacheri TaxID=93214 RepID=UPI002FDEEF2A